MDEGGDRLVRRRRRPLSRVARRLTAVAVAAAVLTACGGERGSGGAGATESDSGLEHIHALGVDPADGVLYAASHHGLFRIRPGKEPQRVGGSQDTMGFLITGPRHYLGSGHPGPQEKDKPANLGLIESTDAGRTWQSVSLSGEVDFHALDVEKGQVFGYDSQSSRLMVSTNHRTWDRRARITAMDIAVAPDDPQFVMATTPQGLAHSADGGKTFILINKAPLMLLDWSPGNALVAVDAQGVVGASVNHGGTWSKLGTVPGTPQALTTHGSREIYVATDKGIYASTDAGRTFSLRQPLS